MLASGTPKLVPPQLPASMSCSSDLQQRGVTEQRADPNGHLLPVTAFLPIPSSLPRNFHRVAPRKLPFQIYVAHMRAPSRALLHRAVAADSQRPAFLESILRWNTLFWSAPFPRMRYYQQHHSTHYNTMQGTLFFIPFLLPPLFSRILLSALLHKITVVEITFHVEELCKLYGMEGREFGALSRKLIWTILRATLSGLLAAHISSLSNTFSLISHFIQPLLCNM